MTITTDKETQMIRTMDTRLVREIEDEIEDAILDEFGGELGIEIVHSPIDSYEGIDGGEVEITVTVKTVDYDSQVARGEVR